jgi:hypothetical protein
MDKDKRVQVQAKNIFVIDWHLCLAFVPTKRCPERVLCGILSCGNGREKLACTIDLLLVTIIVSSQLPVICPILDFRVLNLCDIFLANFFQLYCFFSAV